MTKDTDEFSQVAEPVTCREKTLFAKKMKNHLTRKFGFEGTPKIESMLEVATCCLQGKH